MPRIPHHVTRANRAEANGRPPTPEEMEARRQQAMTRGRARSEPDPRVHPGPMVRNRLDDMARMLQYGISPGRVGDVVNEQQMYSQYIREAVDNNAVTQGSLGSLPPGAVYLTSNPSNAVRWTADDRPVPHSLTSSYRSLNTGDPHTLRGLTTAIHADFSASSSSGAMETVVQAARGMMRNMQQRAEGYDLSGVRWRMQLVADIDMQYAPRYGSRGGRDEGVTYHERDPRARVEAVPTDLRAGDTVRLENGSYAMIQPTTDSQGNRLRSAARVPNWEDLDTRRVDEDPAERYLRPNAWQPRRNDDDDTDLL